MNLLVLLCAFATFAQADDGGVALSAGGARLIDEHPTISMEDESVHIVMKPEQYTVDALFHFYNSGDSTTTLVGFPIEGTTRYLELAKKEVFAFHTYVNGKEVATKDVDLDKSDDELRDFSYKYFKIKEVTFPAHSTTTTRVEYSAPYGKFIPAINWLQYDYSTGASWKGPIHLAVFRVDFSEDLLGLELQVPDPIKITKRSSGTVEFVLQDVKPNDASRVKISFNTWDSCFVENGGGEYCNWPGLGMESLSLGGGKEWDNVPTLLVLRLKRNSLYAAHDHKFADKDLLKYFKQYYEGYRGLDTSEPKLTPAETSTLNSVIKEETAIKSAAYTKP